MNKIVCIFDTHEQISKVTEELKKQNFNLDNISVITKDSKNKELKDPNGKNEEITNDNISGGAMAGCILGGIAGLLVGAGTIVLPGLGAIAAAGPVVGLLTGAATGGIVGALIDLGIPEKNAKEYEKVVKEGKILFSFPIDEENEEEVEIILENNGATDIKKY